jgi:flagellar biogenesis protein FliO
MTSPSFAQSVAPLGPPTADAAPPQAQVSAKPFAVSAAAVKTAPNWLAARPAPKAAAATGSSALPSSGRLLGGLLLLGVLGGAAFYLKRRGRGAESPKLAQPRLSVLASARIGHKAHAVVISVSGRQMLLGVTEGSVKRLAFIDELVEEDTERAPLRSAPDSASRARAITVRTAPTQAQKPGSFGDLLKTAFAKRAPARDADAASIIAAETSDTAFGKPVASAPGVRMLDVEGQAQGLLRRLSGPRA